MSPNIYYLIFLSITIALSIIIFMFKKRSGSLNNPAFISNLLLGVIDESVIVTNDRGLIIFINRAGEKLLKTSQKEILGKNISAIFENNQTKLSPDLKETKVRVGNDLIQVSVWLDKITDKNKKILGYSITLENNDAKENYLPQLREKENELTNINNLLEEINKNKEKLDQNTQQKILERTFDIREEQTRLYASINNLSLGFIMSDKEKNIITINKAAKTLFSITDTATNIKIPELQTRTQGKINFLEGADSVLKNAAPLSFTDIRIDNKYANIFISPVVSPSGTIGIAILTEDKTEQRNADRSREDFYTIASHELRTPLTAIRGYIALIKQLHSASIKNEELKKIINDIDSLSNRLINIVNDFLDTPKLEQGKIRVKKEPCDLIAIITAGIKETDTIATQKNLTVKFTTTFDSATVLGDKEKIRQVLINLISNGIKYTEQGEITINIEKTPDSQYKISITDTGRGVPKENIKFLFSKFQKTDPTKRMTSTGLGLYISKLLVEKMNGTINLENTEEGKGSTFYFTLPIYEQTIASTQTKSVN